MSIVLHFPTVEPLPETNALPGESVRERVWRVLAGMYPKCGLRDRRGEPRFPFPHLIRLQPVEPESLSPIGEPLVVVGKHLSPNGLGFYHQEPIAHRRAIVSLETHGDLSVSLLLDIAWCRFSRHGWYDSGGHFVRVVPTLIQGHER